MTAPLWLQGARAAARNPFTVAAALVFVGIVAYSALGPLVSPYHPNEVDFARSAEAPSLAHPLGTDQFGRDLATRLAAGGRTSLVIVGAALGIILSLGLAYGAVAGVAGGWLDSVMMRTLDGLFALPRLPIAIVILASLSLRAQNVQTLAVALGLVGWMLTARLVRGQMLALRTQGYVRAARAVGASWGLIARRHLIPNSAGILLVAVLLELPAVVVGEAFLAVLGLGPGPPTATWGNIAQEGLHFERLWVMFLPSATIAAFAFSANVLVDALHDVLDPRRLPVESTKAAPEGAS